MVHGWPVPSDAGGFKHTGAAPAHGSAQDDLVALVAGVLVSVQGLVGAAASEAMLRHGAFEQGRRLAQDGGDLGALLERVDRLLGQRTRGSRGADGVVRLEWSRSPLLAARQPLLDFVLLGLYEGLVTSLYQEPFVVSLVRRGPAGAAMLQLVPEGA